MFHIPTKNAREGIQKPLAAAQFRIGVYRIKRLEKKGKTRKESASIYKDYASYLPIL